ncbi:hypothetical protein [Alkalilimnicola ehrlichii]|uniref:RCC1-like domain-containing protein n=2 Tax=Alkalilimnicola ehrlichii TaxID=351052 RepID=A0A3E0WNB8_9GAMM|nr:hypothetical protein [Alkalilimnicola ehrlichii]RFA33547.1 hypothetical protein CAL65_16965 [Alkalilimnicola ehrlichii]
MWAWGSGGNGVLGTGRGWHEPNPVAVDMTALGSARVVMLAAGTHNLALDDQGRLWGWGANGVDQFGDGITDNRWTPLPVDIAALGAARIVELQVGDSFHLIRDDYGRVWAAGAEWALYPDAGTSVIPTYDGLTELDLSALGGVAVVAMAAGSRHALALDANGAVWAWGDNSAGQLGSGTLDPSAAPIAVAMSPLAGASVVAIATGENHSLALDDTGRLWAWGANEQGQTGNEENAPDIVLTPAPVDMEPLEGAHFVWP